MKKIKNFFSSPLRVVLTVICILIVLAAAGIGTFFAIGNSASNKAAAEAAALADAGVDASSAMMSPTDLEWENGRMVYDVEFSANGKEYTYLVAASDNSILYRSAEVDDDQMLPINNTLAEAPTSTPAEATASPVPSETTATPTPAPVEASAPASATVSQAPQAATTAQAGDIGLDAAKNIALTDAGLTQEDVTFFDSKQDYENGTLIYELEFYAGQTEYDYEIDAATGEIRKKNFDTTGFVSTTSGNISVDEAKALALQHAGLTEADVSFTKAKLENDDGRSFYEIEFRQGTVEFDYKIDASSGTILEYEQDNDHH